MGNNTSGQGEIALPLLHPGRCDLPKKQRAASDWTAGNRDKQRQAAEPEPTPPAEPVGLLSSTNSVALSDSQRVRLPRIAEGRELLHRIARLYRGELRTRIVELWG